ncbi:SH3 domain-containing protein [Elizabethkingia argentiflava]|uniref:SH3 domain-containing protein n=1 Tax=Elizabethkingia argenteiflava TaxID=2681556 RepID=A0A845PWI5_9FLAO|nr:SH3 domain-containing protein [Elizabethkingia argenteiflava]NAW50460.1 SH3 domain-containing protein [Elizabethkingia argenteiflava]
MSTLQDKYAGVISAAQRLQISDLKVEERDGILYVSGNASNSADKDAVWDALGSVDPNFSASDINLNIQVAGLASGVNLTVATEQGNLNIRETPSTDASVLARVAKGELVTLVEQTSGEWWLVKTKDGIQGYAYSRYLKV